VCGAADDSHQALKEIQALHPDLVLLDVTLKAGNGIDVLKDIKLRFPKTRVLMLSMHDEEVYAVRALRAGASGYVMKQEAIDTVIQAVRQVLNGEIYLSKAMEKRTIRKLMRDGSKRTGSPLDDLSDRELEVFRLLGQGHASILVGPRQIAAQ